MRIYKKIVAVGLIASTVLGLSGCNKDKDPLLSESKEDLVAMIYDYQSQVQDNITTIQDLETKLRGVTGEDIPPEAISVIGDGTGRLSFNSYKNTIQFPELFMYPDGVPTPADNRVNIVNGVAFVPSSNWVINLNGTTVEVEHVNEITGTLKVVAYSEMYNQEILKVRLDEWVATLPPDEAIQYTKLFVSGNFCGYDVLSANSMIDAEPAVIRVGMLAYGQKAVSYAFVYRGEQDSVKDEAIMSLITSITMNNSAVTTE